MLQKEMTRAAGTGTNDGAIGWGVEGGYAEGRLSRKGGGIDKCQY